MMSVALTSQASNVGNTIAGASSISNAPTNLSGHSWAPCPHFRTARCRSKGRLQCGQRSHPKQLDRHRPAVCRCDSPRESTTPAPSARRRCLLQMAASFGFIASYSKTVHAHGLDQPLRVGPDTSYKTISQAIDAAVDGDVISVAAGMYPERLILQKRVTIMAAANSSVTVSWQTTRPYESTVECRGSNGAIIRGLDIRHRSPSVANNYAVFLQGSDLVMQDCNISSSTGSGIGIEGGEPLIEQTLVRSCESHGIAIFTELGGSQGGGTVRGCYMNANKGNGLLVRGGASPTVTSCIMSGNRGYGASLKGCSGAYTDNSFGQNGKGSIFVDMLADVSMVDLCTLNLLDKLPTVV